MDNQIYIHLHQFMNKCTVEKASMHKTMAPNPSESIVQYSSVLRLDGHKQVLLMYRPPHQTLRCQVVRGALCCSGHSV